MLWTPSCIIHHRVPFCLLPFFCSFPHTHSIFHIVLFVRLFFFPPSHLAFKKGTFHPWTHTRYSHSHTIYHQYRRLTTTSYWPHHELIHHHHHHHLFVIIIIVTVQHIIIPLARHDLTCLSYLSILYLPPLTYAYVFYTLIGKV
ncbi:hypothetical protein BDN72DRAFT_653629 [Pluteus cervinus]|uniref:Uncharacterized protein n=1 Tax=Pluteus cervinus TaxID=181527 RepID=A0ACD3ASF6_9AGAR|nr:hypothetical protein BDN72DRAFT_653629 [Pluteus cervinus]